MSNFPQIKVSSCSIEGTDNTKAYLNAWVFPPSPVTTGVLVGMTDAMAQELVDVLRGCCCDDHGNTIMDGTNPALLTFASRLEQNIAQKAMRKLGRD